MEGTENGWNRPAPIASRWRRALLGGRTGEQPEVTETPRPPSRPPAAPEPPARGRVGNRPEGWAAGIGYPADIGYVPGPVHPPGRGYAASPGHADDSRHTTESRYALLDNGYSAFLAPPRVEPPAIAPPSLAPPAIEPPRAEPVWVDPHRVQPTRVDRHRIGPARVEWRDSRPDAEVERAIGVLRRDLGTPRVLAFANPKGGVHKTTATVLAAATVGSVRGRGVLAWDDNELRGTLGLRAGSARHARTIRHLIADLALIETSHGRELTDRLDDYLRHASDGSYDVLAGEESPRFADRLDQHTVRRVIELLRRTQDVICVDTGNNVESVNWQTVMQTADQLVITTVPREDAAFTADWMIDLLHDIGMGDLATNAVTLLSCPTPNPSPLLDDLRRHFATRTRAVAVVPYDPALESGSSIEYAQLRHETRQAWLKAAAVMVESFAR